MTPLGQSEIAARYGLSPSAVRTMVARGQLPPPTWPSVGGRPAWSDVVIDEWWRRRQLARMAPPDLADELLVRTGDEGQRAIAADRVYAGQRADEAIALVETELRRSGLISADQCLAVLDELGEG